MEWIAFGTVVALAWWCWRQTRERASERKAARERQDLLERNLRLTTRSLVEAKAEIGTLKDRMSRLTESYKGCENRNRDSQEAPEYRSSNDCPGDQEKTPESPRPSHANNETSFETRTMPMWRRGGELPLLLRLGLGRRRLPKVLSLISPDHWRPSVRCDHLQPRRSLALRACGRMLERKVTNTSRPT